MDNLLDKTFPEANKKGKTYVPSCYPDNKFAIQIEFEQPKYYSVDVIYARWHQAITETEYSTKRLQYVTILPQVCVTFVFLKNICCVWNFRSYIQHFCLSLNNI